MLLLPLVSGGHADRLGLLTLLLLALWIGPVAAGQHYTFSTYGLASGLSNLDVTTLIEDHTGLVWVGTQNGIFVADGSRFQEQKPFSDAGLEYIRAMREDAAGRIWAVDSRHLVYLENGRVRSVVALRIHLGAVDLLEVPGQPNTMYLLHDGELFQVASGDGGNSWQVLPAFNPTLKQKHPELLQLNSVINGGGSTVWAGCGSAVCLIDLKKATVRKFDERDGLHPDLWQSLLLTRAGALWARGQHVVEMLPAGSSRFSGVGDIPNASSLIRSSTSMVEDPAGNVLLNLAEGVARTDGKTWQIYTIKSGIPQDEIELLMFDRSGGLWMAPSGHGISRWLGYGNWEGWTKADGLSSNLVWAIAGDRSGHQWLATEGGIDRLDLRSKRIRPQASLTAIHRATTAVVDQRQHVWTADEFGQVFDFNPATGHARLAGGRLRQVSQLVVDKLGRIWISSQMGLEYFTPEDIWTRPHIIGTPSLPKGKVYSISESASGVLWATTASGVFRLNTNVWQPIRLPFQGGEVFYNLMLAAAPDGTLWVQRTLPSSILHLRVVGSEAVEIGKVEDAVVASESVNFMNFDRRGWLWVGSDRGVQVFDGSRWVRSTTADGLLWDDTNSFAFLADSDGSIWIGTSGGVSHLLHPEQLFRVPPPVLRLAEVHLGNNELQEGSREEFDLRKPLLTAHLLSTSYNREGAIVYRYRLEGEENKWLQTEDSNLRFPTLVPSEYTLSVMSFDQRSRQSSALHFVSFTVLEPWWNRGWFRLLEVLGAAALLIGLWRLSIRLLLIRQRALTLLVSLRTKELEREKTELLSARSALIELTQRDGLTGLLNRTAIFERLDSLSEAALKNGSTLAVVMADLDSFKRINDEHGHAVGDTVLRECAKRIRQAIRPDDFAGRYGGEELLILMPGLDRARAFDRVERLRFSIAGKPIRHGDVVLNVTCSFGVAWTGQGRSTPESVVSTADAALYRAKHNGRNRVEYEVVPVVQTVFDDS